MKATVQSNLLKGYKLRTDPHISHIFYANNCLLVARAIMRNAIYIAAIIDAYVTHFGQSINVAKSHITFCPGINCTIRDNILDLLHVSKKRGGWHYLGAPLSSTSLQASDFQFLLNKITNKFTA